jgi:hypothetical protein
MDFIPLYWLTCLLTILCAGALWGSAVTTKADDGTGFDPGDTRGWQAFHRSSFGWRGTQLESHPDYVEDFGFDTCIGWEATANRIVVLSEDLNRTCARDEGLKDHPRTEMMTPRRAAHRCLSLLMSGTHRPPCNSHGVYVAAEC